MKFFTEVDIPKCDWQIDYQSGIMMMGSCFTENVGQKLADLKFNVDINPFGILYNPVSVQQSITHLIERRVFNENDLFYDKGTWNSYSHHTRFSSEKAEKSLHLINERIKYSSDFLKNANYLIVTFGTAWVFQLINSNEIVANCHKIPAAQFKRFRLPVEDIVSKYKKLLDQLFKFNSNLKVIFTVSPIRHWKDGAVENQLSKASLLLAIDEIKKVFGSEKICYFPSYEIVMDELRDYRYYADDMLHLSEVSVTHIFDKFCNLLITNDSLKLSKDVMKIVQAYRHRPLNSGSKEYKKFVLYNLKQIDGLTKKNPFLNFKFEKTHFLDELSQFENSRSELSS